MSGGKRLRPSSLHQPAARQPPASRPQVTRQSPASHPPAARQPPASSVGWCGLVRTLQSCRPLSLGTFRAALWVLAPSGLPYGYWHLQGCPLGLDTVTAALWIGTFRAALWVLTPSGLPSGS
eukprot:228888-Chlamydomonas_euryale.AAC.1